MLKLERAETLAHLLSEYTKILKRIHQTLTENKIPSFVVVIPNATNFFEWNFLIPGPEGTAYEGALYFGSIIFSQDHPNHPPECIEILTPTGCFRANEPIRLDQIRYEWDPSTKGVFALLEAIVNFMISDRKGAKVSMKIELAQKSHEYNEKLGQEGRIMPQTMQELEAFYEDITTSSNPNSPQKSWKSPPKAHAVPPTSTKPSHGIIYDETSTSASSTHASPRQHLNQVVEKAHVIREQLPSSKVMPPPQRGPPPSRLRQNSEQMSKNESSKQVPLSDSRSSANRSWYDDSWGSGSVPPQAAFQPSQVPRVDAPLARNSTTRQSNRHATTWDDCENHWSVTSTPADPSYLVKSSINSNSDSCTTEYGFHQGVRSKGDDPRPNLGQILQETSNSAHSFDQKAATKPANGPYKYWDFGSTKRLPQNSSYATTNTTIDHESPRMDITPQASRNSGARDNIVYTSESYNEDMTEIDKTTATGATYTSVQGSRRDFLTSNSGDSLDNGGRKKHLKKAAQSFNDVVVGDLIDLQSANDEPSGPISAQTSLESTLSQETMRISRISSDFSEDDDVPLESYTHASSVPDLLPTNPLLTASFKQPSSTTSFQHSGMIVTSPIEHHPYVKHIVYVDRQASLFYVPAKLINEPQMKATDLTKWRRDNLLNFGDGILFNAEYSQEHQAWMITEYVKSSKEREKACETKLENGMNLIKTVATFHLDTPDPSRVECWTRLFGSIKMKKLQAKKALANVAYKCWINISPKDKVDPMPRHPNDESSKVINLSLNISFHEFEEVAVDDRGVIWDTPWARYFDKLPPGFEIDDSDEPWNNLEKNNIERLDIIVKQEGIILNNKVVYCPKMPDSYVQLGLEPEEPSVGRRIMLDMFWNDAIESYVVYYYNFLDGYDYEYMNNKEDESMIMVNIDLTTHFKGFYIHPVFGPISDDKKMLGILPICNQMERIKNVKVYIKDERFGRFARFSVGEISREAKKMQVDAAGHETKLYPPSILNQGTVFSGYDNNGARILVIYDVRYPYLTFDLPSRFWPQVQVGHEVRFKAVWTKKGAIFEVTDIVFTQPSPALEKYQVIYSKNENGQGSWKYYFKLPVTLSTLHPSVFEAGPFGIIEDRDGKVGPIKTTRPSQRRGGDFGNIEVVVTEDLSSDRLTHLKIVQQCERDDRLEDLVNALIRQNLVDGDDEEHDAYSSDRTLTNFDAGSMISQDMSGIQAISPWTSLPESSETGSVVSVKTKSTPPADSEYLAYYQQAAQENPYYWPLMPGRASQSRPKSSASSRVTQPSSPFNDYRQTSPSYASNSDNSSGSNFTTGR